MMATMLSENGLWLMKVILSICVAAAAITGYCLSIGMAMAAAYRDDAGYRILGRYLIAEWRWRHRESPRVPLQSLEI